MSKPAKFITILYDILEVIHFLETERSNRLLKIASVGRKMGSQYKF